MAVLLTILAAGCISPSTTKEDVTVSGSSTVMPLAESAAEVFNALQRDYEVTVTGGGTGAGITGIAERRYDIAMASREVTSGEVIRYGNDFQEFEVALDGICLAVSKSIYLAGVEGLTKEQVREIYAGNITSWKDVGGPDEDIYVIALEQGSGTRDAFNEDIMGGREKETPGVDTVAMSSAEVKTAISGSDKAIGYLGFNYLGGGIQAIALDGVMPSIKNIKDNSYQLHRHLYLYTYGNPGPGARAFIEFVSGPEGRKIAMENGFIPV